MAINTLNEISVKAKLINQLRKNQYAGIARSAANTRFIAARDSMINELDNHIVTKELLDSPSKYGESKLITRGNLVSFIGFDDGSLAYGELREYVRFNTQMEPQPNITNDKNKIYYSFPVTSPSLNEIYNNEQFGTPDNWSSRSWVQIIEDGVGNAGYYLFSTLGFSKSRSFFGIQKDKKVKNQAVFTPMKYISVILSNFRDKFK